MNDFTEEWRVIHRNQSYEVSCVGRVRRRVTTRGGAAGHIIRSAELNGYLIVHLYHGRGKYKTCRVHQLVAEAFLGPAPPGTEINHVDTDKHNNVVSNLEYLTHLANMRHASAAGCLVARRGADVGTAVLTESQVLEIVRLKGRMTQKEIASSLGITREAVNQIHNGRNWSWLTNIKPRRKEQ